jgi:hypothetical protein
MGRKWVRRRRRTVRKRDKETKLILFATSSTLKLTKGHHSKQNSLLMDWVRKGYLVNMNVETHGKKMGEEEESKRRR